MAFHTWHFGVFLVIVLGLFWLLARHRNARTLLLLVASYVFYGSWNAWFLLLIAFSTVLDYWCARWMVTARSPRERRLGLICSLCGNIGLLAYFKYSSWSVELLAPLLAPDTTASLADLAWGAVVPVGISFYTLQTLSYTIDVYRGTLQPARNFLDFALFVGFFPQLVAGPIVRASEFLPQLEWAPRFDRARLHDGFYRIGIGLVKKALVADTLGMYLVDPVYEQPGEWAPWVHLLAIYGFAFQNYFDFSGYSDIAIGAARFFGFDLPENFFTPMASKSVREFWRRWHITLAFWVRDYVYFPLGGSRHHEPRVVFNLLATMIIMGLWHGANLLWLAYGVAQGVAMAFERWLDRLRGGVPFATTLPRRFFAWAVTFTFISFSALAVRGESFEQVWRVLTVFGEGQELPLWAWLALAASVLTHYQPTWLYERTRAAILALPTPVIGLLMGLVIGALVFTMSRSTAFIYFQF